MKTVNFIEAVNSKRKFRPLTGAARYPWMYINDDCKMVSEDTEGEFMHDFAFFNSRFELEKKSITITESEFERVWSENVGYTNVNYTSQETGFVMNLQQHKFKREMGF